MGTAPGWAGTVQGDRMAQTGREVGRRVAVVGTASYFGRSELLPGKSGRHR